MAINFPVMMSILIEQLINITDAIFLGHVGEIELGASYLPESGILPFICSVSDSV